MFIIINIASTDFTREENWKKMNKSKDYGKRFIDGENRLVHTWQ